MKLNVNKVSQAASSGSHVTIYEADIEFNSDNTIINVICDQNEPDVDMAVEAIRRGAERALNPERLGATIRVSRIVIHPVDFKPRKFEQYTEKELNKLLKEVR